MNGMSLLLGLPAIGVAIGLFIYALLAGRAGVVAAPDGGQVVDTNLAADAAEAPSILAKFGALATKFTPDDYSHKLQLKLDKAGNPSGWLAERVLAFKGAGLVIGALLGLLLGAKVSPVVAVLVGVAVGAFGLFMPDILIKNMGDKRQIELQKQLPDAMDMLMVCVEAGMGFDSALARVARNLSGPVSEEFARVLQEMQVGKSRTEALRALVARTNVAELRSFVSSMIQSAELGISIGDVLREQSKEMRIKRRQRAQERAQKLQVKLLFPLISCLLPAMFVVILGPAALNIAKFFGKTG